MPFQTFLVRKMNVIAWIEFELACIEAEVQHINHGDSTNSNISAI